MKKAGSLNSKSKIARTSKSSSLSAQDETLFRQFQSNLLSLISHELRTPLMGIMNALSVLDEGTPTGDFSAEELVSMARQNAHRLQRTLVTLLDLAALDSGTYNARLKEFQLNRLVRTRLETHETLFKERKLKVSVKDGGRSDESPILGDPQKLGRAIDLCIQALLPRTAVSSALQFRISSSEVQMEFTLASGMEALWENAWDEALKGFEFAGVMKPERAFLTRMEEGLGSEFFLIQEIMRRHEGGFSILRIGSQVTMSLKLPELSSDDALRAVLNSRAYEVSNELNSVALVLVKIPKKADGKFLAEIKKNLFRASDAVYSLKDRGELALVLDDCKPEDAPRLMNRIKGSVKLTFDFAIAHCPADGLDPSQLLELAAKRLKTSEKR